MTNKTKLMPYIKLIAAILIWAANYHVCKYLVEHVDIYSIASIRFFLASLALLCLLKYKTKQFYHKLSIIQWLAIFLTGVIGVFLYNIFFLMSEQFIVANTVALFWSFSPVITAVGAVILFRIHIRPFGIIGLLIALIGAIGIINYSAPNCVNFQCASIVTQHLSQGQILAILATCSFSGYALCTRFASKLQINALLLTTYSAVIGTICLLIIYALKTNVHLNITSYNFSIYLALIFVALFSTVIAYLWFSESIAYIGVTNTVVFQNTMPLLTILIGAVFLHQTVHYPIIICGIITIIGVIITNFSNNK